MKLVSYLSNYSKAVPNDTEVAILNEKGSPAELGSPRAAWLLESGHVVDVEHAYRWLCSLQSQEIIAERADLLSNLTAIVSQGGNQWDDLHRLYAQWTAAYERANFAPDTSHPGIYDMDAVRLTLPFQPRAFRDFYAFEEHVATCRKRRSLDMVPEWYQFPVFYFSNSFAFRGPNDAVSAPKGCKELDFELEVACVIGKPGKDIHAENADDYIAAYMVLNDWSARDIQRAEVKVGLGPAKGKDFATSCGPYLVTPDELSDVEMPSQSGRRHRLRMSAAVNGRTVSEGNLVDLHFTFAQMIERASADVELRPGDVIGSGTVGTGCILELGTDVQPWLQPGDEVELTVERLGTLRSHIV